MWLDELNELIGTLENRIKKHDEVLSKNETVTRYALIDPLLTALGWDLHDPGQVRTEYNPDGASGRSDYTMFTGGDKRKSQLVIEAKRLGTPIGGKVVDQTITCCVRKGIPYFVVTNGGGWEIYKTSGDVPIEEKRIVDFKLTDPTRTTVMKMLTLWRGNFESESAMVPVVPDRPASQQTANPAPQSAPAESPSSVQRPNRGIPLDQFKPKIRALPPAALLFPDGTTKEMNHWNDFQPLVVEWLVEKGRLTEADCPVRGPKGQHLVVSSSSPVNRKGTRFGKSKNIGSVWVDLHKDTPAHVKAARNILQARGGDANLSNVRVVRRDRTIGR